MSAVVIIDDGCGFRVEASRINQPSRSKLCIAVQLITFTLNRCTPAIRLNASVIKVGVVCMKVGVSRCLKEELAGAIHKLFQVASNKILFKIRSYTTKTIMSLAVDN